MIKNLFIVAVFVKGGIIMIPIVLCSIVALAIFVQRVRFFQKIPTDPEVFMKKIKSALSAKDYAESMKICRRENSPLAYIVASGIDHLDLPREGILDVMKQEALRQMKKVEFRHGILSTIASISPLLGLTGTITGMISSFNVISTVGIGDPTVLAGGISEALYTTAAGLFVGIPCLIAYHWCESKVSDFSDQVEYVSLDLVNFINGAEVNDEKSIAA